MIKLGRLGVWSMIDGMTAAEAASFARQLDDWEFSTLWMPEGIGRDVLLAAGWMLANTKKLIVASGIANLYARDAMAMAAARMQLNEQSNGRFLLGIGLSHAQVVGGLRGHQYGKPLPTMRAYLDGMGQSVYAAPPAAETPSTVLAALGPLMVALAAEKADGAHTYNVTPAHTRETRAALGPGKLLCVEQKVLLESDPARARAVARNALSVYLGLPNYQNSWRREGFGDADFAGDGSDRLIDALVAWGDLDAISRRITQHWEAGADQVCVQTISMDPNVPSGRIEPDLPLLQQLAALR